MKKHLGMIVLALLVVALLAMYTVAYQVGQLTDLVVVTTFGKTDKVLRGDDANEAGLQFKLPYPVQETIRYDGRTFVFDDSYDQTPTKSANLLLTLFCAWRIDDPAKFLRTVKTADAAQEVIKNALRDAKQTAVASRELGELINTDPAKMKLGEVEEQIAKSVAEKVNQPYGVRIVMVGVKSLGLTSNVTSTVINSMREERGAKVAQYETSGNATATAIRERARAASEKIKTFASRKETEIRAEGAAAAASYYEKFRGNEELAKFIFSLESLKKELSKRTVILLDESTLPMLRWFRAPPTVQSVGGMLTQPPVAIGRQTPATAPAK